MIDKIFEALIKRVRETLKSEKQLAITGWHDRNHNKFTRQLLQSTKIVFYERPNDVRENDAFILFTRFVYHKEIAELEKRLKNGQVLYSIPITLGQIRKILESCEDELANPSKKEVIHDAKEVTDRAKNKQFSIGEIDEDVLDFLTTPTEVYEMSSLEKFTKAFLAEAESNKLNPGLVGKLTLGKLRRECEVGESTIQLVSSGWIEGVVSDKHTKTGWYKAGFKMRQTEADKTTEPTDKYELAKYLVSQKESILAQKTKIEEKLARIAIAEKVLAQLSELK